MITPQQALLRLIDNNELFYDEMTDLMRQIMRGEVPPEQIAGILVGLRIKVETVSEILNVKTYKDETVAKAIVQYFSPFQTVDMNKMAKSFNMSVPTLQEKLVKLIAFPWDELKVILPVLITLATPVRV